MSAAPTVERLLELCTARLDASSGPLGTAFFVAPEYALTCSHVVRGRVGFQVRLAGPAGSWNGHVVDAHPALGAGRELPEGRYPAPDVALIRVEPGATPTCALLADGAVDLRAEVVVRGYTASFDQNSVTAESGTFRVDGLLETPDPACTLIKLGKGQALPGMSGAPVLNLSSGEVIGVLRTSRDIRSDLGGWVVPADLIRRLWPAEVNTGHDRFHEADARWHLAGASLRRRQRTTTRAPESAAGRTSIGSVNGGTVITGGTFHGLTIGPTAKPDDGDH
jgi:hypothetical protein